ncbi:MAG: TolC family protein [Bacteroidetes bacterium]|nr:TolC family protein [Bacteroidota bacterium]
MKRVLTFILVFLFAAAAGAQLDKPMTLDDCIRTGMENSKTLKISKYKVDAAEEKLKEVNTAFLPSLKFMGNYSRLSPVDPFVVMGISIAPSILDNYTTKLSLSQPLFTGGRISGTSDMMESNYEAAKSDYDKEKDQLVYDIKNAFWSYYKSIENSKAIDENIRMVEAHLKDIENMMTLGLATNNDVLRVKVQLSNTKLLQIDAQNNVEISMIGLNNVMGLSVNRDTKIEANPDLPKSQTWDLDKLIKEAIANRPEIKAMEYRIKMNESSITVSNSYWYPMITAGANYTYAQPNSRIFPSVNQFKGTWDVGVTLTYDIWNWRLTSHQTAQNKLNLEQARLSLGQIKDGISLEVNQVYLGLVKAKERIPVANETVSQAEENYRVTSEKYKQGLVLNSDVIDAETSLLQAKINYTTSVVDYELMIARLEKSISK